MAYTTPLKVFRSMERIEEHVQEYTDVSGGDTLLVDTKYIVRDAYPSKNKTIILTVDGTVQDSEDYNIDFETNEVTYTGSDSGDASIQHRSGPYNSNTVDDKIASVEEEIDRQTNTTFEGLVTVTDERYDGEGNEQRTYVLDKRPVRSVSKVAVNEPTSATGNPNYVTLTEGLGDDYTDYKELGFRFTGNGKMPDKAMEELQVSYEYGFSDLPADIQEAATLMVIDDLVRGTVSGAMVDGRDNFDPQTVNVQVKQYMDIIEGYTVERMSHGTNMSVEGTTS